MWSFKGAIAVRLEEKRVNGRRLQTALVVRESFEDALMAKAANRAE